MNVHLRTLVLICLTVILGVVLGLLLSTDSYGATPSPKCWEIDSCSQNIGCQQQGSVWVVVVPDGHKLWRSGPQTPTVCRRVYFERVDCMGAHEREDYKSITCGTLIDPKLCCSGNK